MRFHGDLGNADDVAAIIDALAGDAVLFETFITSSPWTTPSHLTMLTSLQPVSHWQAMEREADEDIAAGRVSPAMDVDEFLESIRQIRDD